MRNESIQALVDYAERTGLIESADRVWAVNRLLEVLHADTYTPPKQAASGSLADILRDLCDCALETGALEQDSVVYRDLFDTKLMGALTPAPSQVQSNFTFLYNQDPKRATDWFYQFSQNTNYIRRDRIAKDVKWIAPTEYGDLDITINLSKPEKDPKAIAAAKLMPQSSILAAWRGYTDKDAFIFAETDGEPHNTITPIARMRNGKFELDLVLRNNITTKEHPLGVYHPHAELHHIKKENIGLIEVMGLAVLPARLKTELAAVAEALVSGADLTADERTAPHADWANKLKTQYTFTEQNAMDILQKEVGIVFSQVLEHAGVFKRTETGKQAFLRFAQSVGDSR